MSITKAIPVPKKERRKINVHCLFYIFFGGEEKYFSLVGQNFFLSSRDRKNIFPKVKTHRTLFVTSRSISPVSRTPDRRIISVEAAV